MKRTISFLLFLILILSSCKKETNETQKNNTIKKGKNKVVKKKEKPNVEIVLKNIKTRDSVIIDNKRYYTTKTAIFTTFADSMEISKKTIFNKTPKEELIGYRVPENQFINLSINVTLEQYNYFLEEGDKLIIEFDNNGFVSKSILNGKENNPALLFSRNTIPVKSIEYLKYMKEHSLGFNDNLFEKNFQKKFDKRIQNAKKTLQKLKKDIKPNIYFALEKHLEYTNLKNKISRGSKVKVKKNDLCMSLRSYRKLNSQMLHEISDIDYWQNEKTGIDKAFETVDILMSNKNNKKVPKTSLLILRELLDVTGSYEPNLIPELIAKIPDTKTRKQYLESYTSQYILELKDKRNEVEKLNLISSGEPKTVSTFQDFLNAHKGKIIYIDLWASWCGPCKKQLKNSHKLKKELKNYPIVFGYFSIDKSFSKWKTSNIEEEMDDDPNSFLFFNTKKSKRYLSWEVRGIPRYLIFDKFGNLINKKAPAPNNPEIKNLLLRLAK